MWIDAHVHLWEVKSPYAVPIRDRIAALARDYTLGDLERDCASLDVSRFILVQAAPSHAETEYFLDLCHACPASIAAVIGWVDLTDPKIAATLDIWSARSGLVGVREIAAFAQRADYLLGDGFQHGLATLRGRGLCLDLVVRPDQLQLACELVRRNPQLKVNINHCGRPLVHCGDFASWAEQMSRIARFPGATCKLSGLVERAGFDWDTADLKPYVSHLLDTFGPNRLLFASNWPVMNVVGTYARWWDALHEILDALGATSADRAEIFRVAAVRFYAIGEAPVEHQ